MRLFNKQHNFHGCGNIDSKNLIIVNNVDYTAYKHKDFTFSNYVEIIKQCDISSTGVLDLAYIVPFIRCCQSVACEINQDVYDNCLKFLYNNNFNCANNILICGSIPCYQILKCSLKDSLGNMYINNYNVAITTNYSPYVKFYNEEEFNKFIKYIRDWLDFCENGINNFNLIRV